MKFLTSPVEVIFALVFIYLTAQAFTGEQGIFRWRQYTIEANQLEAKKAELIARRQKIEEQINTLNSQTPSHDLIEELAYSRLNLAKEGDLIIKLEPPKPKEK